MRKTWFQPNVTSAAGSAQWLGQCSGAILQQFSRDSSRAAMEEAVESRGAIVEEFEDRHGKGKGLNSEYPAGIGNQ